MITPSLETFTERLKAHLDQADHGWFARHPHAQWRKRMYVPGEADIDPPITTTIIFRRRNGSIVRVLVQEIAA